MEPLRLPTEEEVRATVRQGEDAVERSHQDLGLMIGLVGVMGPEPLSLQDQAVFLNLEVKVIRGHACNLDEQVNLFIRFADVRGRVPAGQAAAVPVLAYRGVE